MNKGTSFSSLLIAATLAAATPAWGAIVDDFGSYAVGGAPGAPWADIDNSTLNEPTIANDANNIAGNHLRYTARYPYDTIGRALPNALTADGDYLQIAINVVEGKTLASFILDGTDFAGGGGNLPLAAVGIETWHNQFTTAVNTVFDDANDFYVNGADPVAPGRWYYLRATVRDSGGLPGVIDSYDFHVYADADATTLLGQRIGIPFTDSAEGSITHIAIRMYEQTDVSPYATALFDEITTNVVPEPASAMLLMAGLGMLRGRRRL